MHVSGVRTPVVQSMGSGEFSQRFTVIRSTPSFSARSLWVSPSSLRRNRTSIPSREGRRRICDASAKATLSSIPPSTATAPHRLQTSAGRFVTRTSFMPRRAPDIVLDRLFRKDATLRTRSIESVRSSFSHLPPSMIVTRRTRRPRLSLKASTPSMATSPSVSSPVTLQAVPPAKVRSGVNESQAVQVSTTLRASKMLNRRSRHRLSKCACVMYRPAPIASLIQASASPGVAGSWHRCNSLLHWRQRSSTRKQQLRVARGAWTGALTPCARPPPIGSAGAGAQKPMRPASSTPEET